MFEKALGNYGKANESSPLNRSTLDSKSLKPRYPYEGSVCQLDVIIPITVNGHKTSFSLTLKQTFCVI